MSAVRSLGVLNVASRLTVDLTVLLVLSLVLFVYQRAIIPIYGTAPSTYTLKSVVATASLVAAARPFRVSQLRLLLSAGLVFSAAPLATYWVAVWTARWHRPILGPLLTHSVVLVPLLSVLASFVVETNLFHTASSPRTFQSRNSVTYRSLAGLVCYIATVVSSQWWTRVSYLNYASESQIFLGLAAATFNVWIVAYKVRRPPATRKKVSSPTSPPFFVKPLFFIGFNLLWWTNSRFLASPVLQHPLPQPYMHPSFPLLTHSAVQSTTGLIVVGEALPPPTYQGGPDSEMHSLRYLRASHSLLGGVWMGHKVATLDDAPPQVDSFGTSLGDSIYSTFVLQEAARLVNSTSKGATGEWERTLVIGLGIGTSAAAFNRHGISTTIVEIDPAVYEAARLYFGLPDQAPGNLFFEDARTWATRRRISIQAGMEEAPFDIIVHDCFSGGGVPEHIFTVEFWDDLKASLHPEGVVVVNFAGMIISDSSRMISQTLKRSFGNCRAFHDSFADISEQQHGTEFINLVFFCTSHSNPLTFRTASRSDYLDSYLREHVLSSLPSREVAFELLTGQLDDRFILTDSHNPLGKLQDALGHHHWSLMRDVLPDVFWETY